jgi:hypothetical protein
MLPSLLLVAFLHLPLPAPACPIDRQIYQLQSDRRFTAGFDRAGPPPTAASDLYFWLKTPGRTYRFVFHSPNGYGGTHIVPASAKESEEEAIRPIPFDAFRADLSVYRSPPTSADPAPARLFARGLGPELWYNSVALAGGDEAAKPESMPIGMFVPAACEAAQKKSRRR